MLNKLRNSTGNYLVKFILIIVAISFIAWGIGGKGLNNNQNNVLEIGDLSFTSQQWRILLNNKLSELRHVLQQDITIDILKDSGFLDNLLHYQIDNLLLLQEVKKLGIIISDEMVKYNIALRPEFMNKEGVFDPDIFDSIISSWGITETQLIDTIRNELAVSYLLDAITVNQLMPEQVISQFERAKNVKQKINMYSVVVNKVKLGGLQPDKAQLLEIYEKNKEKYTIPQKRKFQYMSLNINDLKSSRQFSEQDLLTRYNDKKFMFQQAESIRAERILVPKEKVAFNIWQRINNGEQKFADVAAAYSFNHDKTASEVQFARGDISDTKFEDQLFSLNVGQMSKPIKNSLGWNIFKIIDKKSVSYKKFNVVRDIINEQLLAEDRFANFSKLMKRVEQLVANGSDIKTIAKAVNKRFLSGSMSIDDKLPNKLTTSKKFKSVVFDLDKGKLSAVNMNGDDEFFVVLVTDVIPASYKNFTQVQGEIKKEWFQAEKYKKAKEIINLLHDNIDIKLPVLKEVVEVNCTNSDMNRDFVNEVCHLKKDEITTVHSDNNKYYIAKIIEKILPPQIVKNDTNAILDQSMKNALIKQYINYLHQQYSIKIDYEQAYNV